jgi:hypothetical protein
VPHRAVPRRLVSSFVLSCQPAEGGIGRLRPASTSTSALAARLTALTVADAAALSATHEPSAGGDGNALHALWQLIVALQRDVSTPRVGSGPVRGPYLAQLLLQFAVLQVTRCSAWLWVSPRRVPATACAWRTETVCRRRHTFVCLYVCVCAWSSGGA